ncbi:MAG: UDP binding domain-containing protein [Candidatus Helarchaeota archaeon]
MNEISILYEKLGIDTFEIIKAASSKWNFVPHFPGAGVGGPCLPANPYYLIQEGMKVGFVPHLIRFAREINDRMPAHLIELILDALNEAGKTVKNANICLLGMSYKENIGDAQVSPFFPIYNALRELKANIKVHDPHFLNKNPLSITIESSIENALEDADCIVFITAHDEFKKLRLENVQLMASSPLVIVDGRNVTDNKKLPKGTIFRGIGRLKSSDFE